MDALKKSGRSWAVVAHTFNPTREGQRQVGLCEFEGSQPGLQNSRNTQRNPVSKATTMTKMSRMWQCMLLIPALRRLRQTDLCEFEANLL